MSEEEIMNKVEQFIDDYRQYDTRTGETIIPYKYGEGQRYVYKETYYAIQGLLDLYNKEKEKNIKLQKRNNRQVKIIKKRDKNMEELKAINQKCKELGWLDE